MGMGECKKGMGMGSVRWGWGSVKWKWGKSEELIFLIEFVKDACDSCTC